MFKRKPKDPTAAQKGSGKKILWAANIVLVLVIVLGLSAAAIIHESDTNPELCRTCHLMEAHVDSYLTSNNLDHVHEQAGVECKECHDYSIEAEITSGIKYITGDYDVVSASNPELIRRTFSDEMCLKCHISYEHIADQTDYLVRNPHLSHWPSPACRTCHVSHGEQIDYCSECHDNGGQRLVGAPIVPRVENPWQSGEGSPDAPTTR